MTLTYIVLATTAGGLLSVLIAASVTLTRLGRLVRHLVSLSVGVLLGTALLHVLPGMASPVPQFQTAYFGWLVLGALGQLGATAFLLAAMKERNFVVGVAYSKTDALQVALLGAVFLRELPGPLTLLAIALATAGVVLLS